MLLHSFDKRLQNVLKAKMAGFLTYLKINAQSKKINYRIWKILCPIALHSTPIFLKQKFLCDSKPEKKFTWLVLLVIVKSLFFIFFL